LARSPTTPARGGSGARWVWRDEDLLLEAQVHLACIDLDRLRARGLPKSVYDALG